VENRAALDSLVALGCDSCQGYYISHPLPYERFMNWPEHTSDKT
jgi:EAL domain-containing protein (putative c-di-GMP-specific phosphodiesterase class I)